MPLQVREFEVKKVPVPSIGPDEVLIKGGSTRIECDSASDLRSQHLRPLRDRCECLAYRSAAQLTLQAHIHEVNAVWLATRCTAEPE
jgi:hypothetical protein